MTFTCVSAPARSVALSSCVLLPSQNDIPAAGDPAAHVLIGGRGGGADGEWPSATAAAVSKSTPCTARDIAQRAKASL